MSARTTSFAYSFSRAPLSGLSDQWSSLRPSAARLTHVLVLTLVALLLPSPPTPGPQLLVLACNSVRPPHPYPPAQFDVAAGGDGGGGAVGSGAWSGARIGTGARSWETRAQPAHKQDPLPKGSEVCVLVFAINDVHLQLRLLYIYAARAACHVHFSTCL